MTNDQHAAITPSDIQASGRERFTAQRLAAGRMIAIGAMRTPPQREPA